MPFVTLLSDFGTRDASVAITKGILYQIVPGLILTDISHNVTPFSKEEAAYLLVTTYKNFPEGTVHLVLADLLGSTRPRLILAQDSGYFFIAPDNGVLPLAFGRQPRDSRLGAEFAPKAQFSDWIKKAGSLILDCLNIPGGLPGHLAPVNLDEKKSAVQRIEDDNTISCNVVHIDHYENIILDCTLDEFEQKRRGRTFEVKLKHTETLDRIHDRYTDVREGEVLCRFNSAGRLEVSVRNGKAAGLLGVRIGSPNNEIKIVFQ